MIDSLEKLLELDEGLRLKPYRDTVGKLTIGIGRNLDDCGISKEEAYHLLDNDIHACNQQLNDTFSWFLALDEVRKSVIMSMCFNMGLARLLGFKQTLTFVGEGEYTNAGLQLLDSKAARDLPVRYHRLAKMLETGKWPV